MIVEIFFGFSFLFIIYILTHFYISNKKDLKLEALTESRKLEEELNTMLRILRDNDIRVNRYDYKNMNIYTMKEKIEELYTKYSYVKEFRFRNRNKTIDELLK